MDTQLRPRTRTAPRRRAEPHADLPVQESVPAAAPAPRPRTRTAPAAGRTEHQVAVVIPEPFNPYLLPADRSHLGWVRWSVQALVLSVIATLIWDRGTAVRAEVKGKVTEAPAQWVSALVLVVGSFALAASLGVPWGAIPLAACFVVLTRRVLAAEGAELTLEAATDKLIRKVVLAGVGIGAWLGAIVLGAWVSSMTAGMAGNPLAIMAGATAAADMQFQAMGIARDILRVGTGTAGVLIVIAVFWWSHGAHRAAMATTAEERRTEEKTINAEETVNV